MNLFSQIEHVAEHAVLYARIRQEMLGELTESGQGGDFQVDMQQGRIAFNLASGGQITGKASLVASIAVEPQTMLWGWAPMFSQNRSIGAAHTMRQFGEQHGLEAFTTVEVPYPPRQPGDDEKISVANVSHTIGWAAIEVLGPDKLYYSTPSSAAGSRVVLLIEELSTPVERPDWPNILPRLPRLLESVKNTGWAVEGLARMLGWHFAPQPPTQPGNEVFRITDPQGTYAQITTERDQYGRITYVRVEGPRRDG